ILDVTKLEGHVLELKMQNFNLKEAMTETIASYKSQVDDHNVTLAAPSFKDIYVTADKGRINQVLSNLLSNALNAARGGSVVVTADRMDDGTKTAIVKVKDSGKGIEPEMMRRLFTKFSTKSNGGTGLGLFISKSIVEAHGGRIWAENNADG